MTISAWAIWAVITAIILIAVGIWFIRSFYRRSSKEIAFVRTGLGGQKVIIDGAAFVFPILLLHPLALTNVLCVAQRMNSLATLFTLWGLIAYVRGRWHMDAGRENRGLGFMVLGIVGGGALASLSKENGVLLPFYALVIEAAVYRFRTALPSGRNKLLALFGVVALAPLLVAVIYVGTHPEWLLRPYEIRSFTLTERLMTESRVLWTYLKWIVAPSNIELGLFHDDIPASTGLLQPVTTLVSILGLGLMLAAAFLARNRGPWVALGILGFLVGHSLEAGAVREGRPKPDYTYWKGFKPRTATGHGAGAPAAGEMNEIAWRRLPPRRGAHAPDLAAENGLAVPA